MDAVTLCTAAIAVACDQSRNAALEDAIRDRELAQMRVAGLESLIAQRMFPWSQQLRRPGHVPDAFYSRTWQECYSELETDYHQMRTALNRVGIANARGDRNLVARLVRTELGFDVEEPAEPEPAEPEPAEPEPAEPEPAEPEPAEPEPAEPEPAEPEPAEPETADTPRRQRRRIA